MIGTISAADLDEPIGRSYVVAVRLGRHIAVQLRIG
jgi:hypothetical protein